MNIDIVIPTSWKTLSLQQLKYIYRLIAAGLSFDNIITSAFLRFSGLRLVSYQASAPVFEYRIPRRENSAKFRLFPRNSVIFSIPTEEFNDHLRALDFIKSLPTVPVRLPYVATTGASFVGWCISSFTPKVAAIDAYFHGIPFERFLAADTLYQRIIFGFSKDPIMFSSPWFPRLLQILYPGIRPQLYSPVMCISALYWMAGLKASLSKMYPDLFGHGSADAAGQAQSLYNPARSAFESRLRESINAQIRALSQGDVTRRDQILAIDTHTALAELDAQAREAAAMQSLSRK